MLVSSKLIIGLIVMVLVIGGFIGLICLQTHISKHDKRGKFVIPITLFLLPIVVMVLSTVLFMGTVQKSAYTIEEISDENGVVTERYQVDEDGTRTPIEKAPEEPDVATGNYIMVCMMLLTGLSFPCAIITLIIELVYRSRRKRVCAEDVIDIQNL